MSEVIVEGHWNDGEKASSSPVSVIFEPEGLAIRGETGQVAFLKFSELAAAAPIQKRSNEALLTDSAHGRARLFIREPGIGRVLLERAPQIADGARRFRVASLSLIVTAAAAAVIAVLFFGRFSLSRMVANWIPQDVADKIGLQGIEMFGPITQACDSVAGKAALQLVLERLEKGSDYGPHFKLHIARSKVANAFALPGRHIVLLSALVKQAKSPEEVAGVLAHEMGHGLEKDPETLFVRHIGMQTAIQLLTGQSGNGNALTIGALLLQLRYSRDAERSADGHALVILKNAHIGSKPTADFFLRNVKGDEDAKSALNYLSTHPSSQERAKLFLSQPDYQVTPILSDKQWADAQAICDEASPKKPKQDDKRAPDKQTLQKT